MAKPHALLPFDRVTLGQIGYINVAPVYAGLENGFRPDWLRIVSGSPSELNMLLENGLIDISPVSSAAYANNHDRWVLLPGTSISCFGAVQSVLLVSRHPFEKLSGKTIYLTSDSASASALLKVLFRRHHITPSFRQIPISGSQSLPTDTAAALVIGDTALKENWKHRFPYNYDLGTMWLEETGLPFVFALWAVRKSFADNRPEAVNATASLFEAAKSRGLKSLKQISATVAGRVGLKAHHCEAYFNCLDYRLNDFQIRGLKLFYDLLFHYGILLKPVELSFFKTDTDKKSTDSIFEPPRNFMNSETVSSAY
jgi:chorismate dehydratase